ncbi:hypothetical protein QEH56_14650 [Pelagicoccus enzymogenes]|uniref:hypothetical protein n=1 Tax=Pelagicoccus enzymogenes TaxID=2773457 RepID=UPI00280C9094|nr:hypothetical protein [Pelagicoccus enzymogenes]MDQ8199403.1 hypothetical protein [Pelagicoccus enzymogenes]
MRDLNGDGETDFYECVNGDHQVTEHFHEFAMGLQVDRQGNFYYAKSARHGKPGIVPHHGTVIRVSADGERSDVVAHGLRAANGVCLNADGSLVVTDQEGHWTPMNRINWVEPGNRFFGNLFGYGAPEDASDKAMESPLLWIDKEFDRSPAEPLWVESESWGVLDGKLLSLSYGRGEIDLVLRDEAATQHQGAIVRLPVPSMPTGIVRGRFHPAGALYVCGLSAWATNQTGQQGGLFRVRATKEPLRVPISFQARPGTLEIRFSCSIDPASLDFDRAFEVEVWSLLRSEKYGSERYGERSLTIEGRIIGNAGSLVSLSVPALEEVDQVKVRFDLQSTDGEPVRGVVLGTIKRLSLEN